MPSLRRRVRKNRGWLAPLLRLVVLACLVLLAGAGLLAWQAYQARDSLTTARQALTAARGAVERGDVAAAQLQVERASQAARQADEQTSYPWWDAYGRLPLAGPLVREAQGIARETRTIATDVLPPLVGTLGEGGERWDGRLDLGALAGLTPELVRADRDVTASLARLRALPYSRVARVDGARQELDTAVVELAREVRDAAVMAQVLPTILGGERPGRVLVVAQNLAEARATGGLVGAYAVLATHDGAFRLQRSGSNRELVDASSPVVDLGPDFQSRYGRAEVTSTWRSANLTPDTPSAGAVLAGLARRQLGIDVDAVLLVSPVALADVLRATGPVRVAGAQLTPDNVVDVLLRGVYQEFPAAADNPARDAVFDSALRAVVLALQRPGLSRLELVRGLRHAVGSGHLQLFATDDRAQRLLASVPAGGALPSASPYLSVVTQDVGGSKLDYYLRRYVSYESRPSGIAVDLGAGPEDEEIGTVTVRLRNTAPTAGLPAYVTARTDRAAVPRPPVGQLRSWVSVYLGPRSSYQSATLDGRPVSLSSHVEGGLAVFSTYVDIDPGREVTLVLRVHQPARRGSALLWRQQPRVVPDVVRVVRDGAARPYSSYYDD